MKNGLFSQRKPILTLCFLTILLGLNGCASFLQMGEAADDPNDYDRGYSRGEPEGTVADLVDRAMFRKPASVSDAIDELSGPQKRIRDAIDTRDVVIGMSRHDVTESWGLPTQREVAGSGNGGHERWTYGSRYSLNGSRTVIFENGKVAGWNR